MTMMPGGANDAVCCSRHPEVTADTEFIIHLVFIVSGLTRFLESHSFFACGSVEEPLFCSKISPTTKIWSKNRKHTALPQAKPMG